MVKKKKKKPVHNSKAKPKPSLYFHGGWMAKMSAKLEAMRKMFP